MPQVPGWIKRGQEWRKDKFTSWSMTIGPVLMIAGLFISVRGIYYTSGSIRMPPEGATHPVEGIIDLAWWGVIWIVVGAVCLISSVRPRQPVASLALGAAMFLSTIWGFSFLIDWIVGGADRGWIMATPFLLTSAYLAWGSWITSRVADTVTATREEVRESVRRDAEFRDPQPDSGLRGGSGHGADYLLHDQEPG